VSQFLTEIHEQPAALRALVEYYRGEGAGRLDAARALCEEPGRSVLFAGMGSSYYAPMAIRARLAAAGARVDIVEAGELLHYELGACTADTVVVAVSQSGESAETRQIAEALAGRCRLVAVTNEPDSALGRCGEIVLPMCAGKEAAISTKTYTNTLALLYLLGVVLSSRDLDGGLARLEQVAADMQARLDQSGDEMAGAAAFLEGASFLYFVARGPAVAAAYQGALTFNEGARLPTCALPGGTFRHGPLELVDKEFAAVFLAPHGPTRELILGLASEVVEAGGRALVLTDDAPPELGDRGHVIELPHGEEDLFPLRVCVPVELLLYHMARQRGGEAGVFQRIGKVTRRE